MKLSLVVPCYNEESNIALMYDAVKADFKDVTFDYEMVFVNDGSKDGTLGELKKLLSGDVPVKIVNFSRNFGKESAMYAGLKESEGEYVTIIDADLQQRPSIALEMVSMLDSDPDTDCVACYQEQRSESKLVVFLKENFYKIINKFADTEFVSGASDFRTFRRPMVNAIVEMGEYFRFSKGLFSWVGFNTKFIPYKADERATGESKWSVMKLFSYAFGGIIAFTTAPLKIATALGAVSGLFSVIWLIAKLIALCFGVPFTAAGWLIFLVTLLGGAILVCLGIIGEYLARVYIQTKGRPIYIAKNVFKNFGSEDK